jgi:hypothetical protein
MQAPPSLKYRSSEGSMQHSSSMGSMKPDLLRIMIGNNLLLIFLVSMGFVCLHFAPEAPEAVEIVSQLTFRAPL